MPVLVFSTVMLPLVLIAGVRAIIRYRRPRTPVHPGPEARRCRCGYSLAGLDMPRCPECGRAVGFDRTFEDLGIAEAEVRAHVESKKAVPRRAE